MPDPVPPGSLPFELKINVKSIEMKEIALSPLTRLATIAKSPMLLRLEDAVGGRELANRSSFSSVLVGGIR